MVAIEIKLVTDELFMHYQRCHRRTFLEFHGDPSQKALPPDYLGKIIADSASHRRDVIGQYPYQTPTYGKGDWQGATAATLDLMAQGVDTIHRGILAIPWSDHITLMIKPDLLVKQPGQSQFGNWVYQPIQVRLGRRPKLEYQLTAAFQVWVLAQSQQGWPEDAGLILRHQGFYSVCLAERLPQMESLLMDCLTMVAQSLEPEVFISRNRCSLCVWLGACHDLAQAQRHLSLLPGITPKRYGALQTLHITTLEQLAQARPAQLQELPGFEGGVAQRILDQARSTFTNQALLYHLDPLPPDPGMEFYFDIEAQPDLQLAYLYGVLQVNSGEQRQQFYGCLAEAPDQEQQAWQQFLDLVLSYPGAPIYHFCSYELDTARRLARTYGLDTVTTQALLARFVDIHAWVTRTVTLPIESYALKAIAHWLGFDWRLGDVNGAQAICWYDQWLETGDRQFLELILSYNEDDCRATYAAKQWLDNFLKNGLTNRN
jgi:uncharacterized protein